MNNQKTKTVPPYVLGLNRLIRRMLRAGVPIGPMTLLTVRGRTSGKPRTTPVAVMEHDGHRWLAATFGETDWVRNLRSVGKGTLTRGDASEAVAAVELSPEQAGVALQEFLGPRLRSRLQAAFLKQFYALRSGASLDDYIREARLHPVFELQSATTKKEQ